MSDERLRSYERTWQESLDPDDGARVLIERLRTGSIEESGLRLAAFLGDEAAKRAAEQLGLAVSEEIDAEFGRWLVLIGEYGVAAAARAGAACARYEMTRFKVEDPQARQLLEALFLWTEGPNLEAFSRVKLHYEVIAKRQHWKPSSEAAYEAAQPAIIGASCVIDNCAFAVSFIRDFDRFLGDPEPELRRAIRDDLCVWALSDRRPRPESSEIPRRVRAGELDGERVYLAAYLGDPKAREALGPRAPAASAFLIDWLTGLLNWETTPLLRAFCSIGRLVCSRFPPSSPQERALEDLIALSEEPGSGPKMEAALQDLEGLVREARKAPENARPVARLFQHLLTLPWFIDPFWPDIARAMEEEGVIGSDWSGSRWVDVDGERYLCVHGSDSCHTEAIEYLDSSRFSQNEAIERLSLLMVSAARDLGLSDELMRRTIREDLIPWALR